MQDTAPCHGAIHPSPLAFGTSCGHAPWVRISVWDFSTLRWDACLGWAWLTRSCGGRGDADLTPSYRKFPQKSIPWEHICFRSFFLPATASFLLLLYSLSFLWVISSPSLFFLKPVLLHHCCHQAWCVWPKADVCSKAGAQDLPAEAGRGLLAALPSRPLPSPPLPCPQQQAILQMNTCSHPIRNNWCQNRQENTTRTVLMCHKQMDEYFIVIPGKAFKRTHETTIMWSCLSTQIKNISDLTLKGKDFLNENIVS